MQRQTTLFIPAADAGLAGTDIALLVLQTASEIRLDAGNAVLGFGLVWLEQQTCFLWF